MSTDGTQGTDLLRSALCDAKSALCVLILDLAALETAEVASLRRAEAACCETVSYGKVLILVVHLGRAEPLCKLPLLNRLLSDGKLVTRSHPVEIVCAIGNTSSIVPVTKRAKEVLAQSSFEHKLGLVASVVVN